MAGESFPRDIPPEGQFVEANCLATWHHDRERMEGCNDPNEKEVVRGFGLAVCDDHGFFSGWGNRLSEARRPRRCENDRRSPSCLRAVSYTHLTLPTIYSV